MNCEGITPVKLVRIRGAMLISLSMSTCTKDGHKNTDTHQSVKYCQLRYTDHLISLSTLEDNTTVETARVCVFFYLQIGCEWVREPHVAWEGTEDEVAKLDAVRWNHITEAIMVVTQELWEVMQ